MATAASTMANGRTTSRSSPNTIGLYFYFILLFIISYFITFAGGLNYFLFFQTNPQEWRMGRTQEAGTDSGRLPSKRRTVAESEDEELNEVAAAAQRRSAVQKRLARMRQRAGTKPRTAPARAPTPLHPQDHGRQRCASFSPFSPFFFLAHHLYHHVQQPSSGYPKCSSSTEVRSAVAREPWPTTLTNLTTTTTMGGRAGGRTSSRVVGEPDRRRATVAAHRAVEFAKLKNARNAHLFISFDHRNSRWGTQARTTAGTPQPPTTREHGKHQGRLGGGTHGRRGPNRT